MAKPVDALIKLASGLSTGELQLLVDAIQGLLDARAGENGAVRVQDGDETTEKRTLTTDKQGSFEHKLIKGYGPYLYLRWWSGGKHRSTYLGKAPH